MNYPEMCFVFIPTTNEVGIVKWGESGYYKTDYPHTYTKEIVAELNEELGLTKAESHAMKMCSMANIDKLEWKKHFKKCIDIYEKHTGRYTDAVIVDYDDDKKDLHLQKLGQDM